MSDTTKPGLNREIATTADGMDITRGYVGPLLTPYDSVLRNRGGDLTLYEQVLSDPQVKATVAQRQLAVTQCEWQVDAGGKRAIDQSAADFMREQINRIGWDNITTKMLYGVFYGYAVAELIYEVQGRYIGIKQVKVRNRRRFRFGKQMDLRLLTYEHMLEGIPAEAPYFWSFSTGADNDDEPYGLGLAHWLYWPVLFKRNGIKFWLIFLEKFGMPTGVGKYGSDANAAEKSKLLQAVRAIQTDSGIIIPEGMTVELLEAARSGTSDYAALHDTMDATIAKVVLGQTASTQGTPGKLGNDKLQGDVRADIIKADADLVCESWNMGPARWLTAWNFPGAAVPRVYRVTAEPEDLTDRADRDGKIKGLGFKPTLDYITATYGEGWEEAAATPPMPVPPPRGSDGAQFAEAPAAAPTPAESIADALTPQAQPVVDGWVDQLAAMVDAAGSLEELREMILAAYADLPADKLASAIATALQTAQAAGRYDVEQTGA
jgi:phage gp29-like protein